MTTRICIIGVGNTLMGDDGIGVAVAEELSRRHPETHRAQAGVEIVSGHTAGMGLMPHVMAAERVVFVDAIDAGDEPGSVFLFDPDAVGLSGLRSTTSHGIGIPSLIGNARLQGHWPRFTVYAIQIGDVMCGPDTLSPPIERTVGEVADLIETDVGLVTNEAP